MLSVPPLTELPKLLAVFSSPPLTELSKLLAVFSSPPLTELSKLLAVFSSPPLTELSKLLAVLSSPPLTALQAPLAVLPVPPLTELSRPGVLFPKPPVTVEPPAAGGVVPTQRDAVRAAVSVVEAVNQLGVAAEPVILAEDQIVRAGLGVLARMRVIAQHQVALAVLASRLTNAVLKLHVQAREHDRRLAVDPRRLKPDVRQDRDERPLPGARGRQPHRRRPRATTATTRRGHRPPALDGTHNLTDAANAEPAQHDPNAASAAIRPTTRRIRNARAAQAALRHTATAHDYSLSQP